MLAGGGLRVAPNDKRSWRHLYANAVEVPKCLSKRPLQHPPAIRAHGCQATEFRRPITDASPHQHATTSRQPKGAEALLLQAVVGRVQTWQSVLWISWNQDLTPPSIVPSPSRGLTSSSAHPRHCSAAICHPQKRLLHPRVCDIPPLLILILLDYLAFVALPWQIQVLRESELLYCVETPHPGLCLQRPSRPSHFWMMKNEGWTRRMAFRSHAPGEL